MTVAKSQTAADAQWLSVRPTIDLQAFASALPFLLAALLITSGSLKAHQLATEPVLASGLLTSRWFVFLVVHFEWLLGAWLLAGVYRRAAWWVATGTFAVFSIVAVTHLMRGDSDCGCFGTIKVNPWVSLSLNLAVVVTLMRVRRSWVEKNVASRPVRRIALAFLCLLAVTITGDWAMANFEPSIVDSAGVIVGSERTVVLEPKDWIGLKFPLLPYIDNAEFLEEGSWEVWLHREACAKCMEKLRWLQARNEPLVDRQIAIVALPSDHARKRTVLGGGLGRLGSVECVRLAPDYEWFVETPVTLHLQNGNVLDMRDD